MDEKIETHLATADQRIKDGDMDGALTEYRRIVLIDPNHVQSLYEIGRLCRNKANEDPMFFRYAYESAQKAARLDLNHQEAHDLYITLAKQMNKLDTLHQEYEKLSEENPDNELLKQCKKNIFTISMALMPDKVNMGGGSAKIRKFLLFGSLAGIFFGLGLMLGFPIINKQFNLNMDLQLTKFAVLGAFSCVTGIVLIFIRARLK